MPRCRKPKSISGCRDDSETKSGRISVVKSMRKGALVNEVEMIHITPEMEKRFDRLRVFDTLWDRALDARKAQPMLADPMAEDMVGRVDYNFAKLPASKSETVAIMIRERQFDAWIKQFIA